MPQFNYLVKIVLLVSTEEKEFGTRKTTIGTSCPTWTTQKGFQVTIEVLAHHVSPNSKLSRHIFIYISWSQVRPLTWTCISSKFEHFKLEQLLITSTPWLRNKNILWKKVRVSTRMKKSYICRETHVAFFSSGMQVFLLLWKAPVTE